MTKIVQKRLPNAVSYADLADPAVRQKVMLLKGNIECLAAQLAEAQKALVELQGGAAKVNVASLAAQVAPLVEQTVATETATAAASALAAAGSAESASGSAIAAGTSETNAGNSATAAGESETSAAQSATDAGAAKTAAESARDRAEAAAASSVHEVSFAVFNQDLGADQYTKFPMSALVTDATKTYDVCVTFNNTGNEYARTCTVTGESGECATAVAGKRSTASAAITVAGTEHFKIDNVASTVDVFVKISEHQGGN